MVEIGDEVGGYRLLSQLGTGGAGTVWRAQDGGGNDVALKLLHPALASSEAARQRLIREARTVNSIGDRGVAAVLDIEADASVPFVVSEYVAGPTLASLIARGPLSVGAVAHLAAQLARIIHAVHRAGVIHRDIKPSNVICSDTGPVLIDFGIAMAADDERLTMTGLVSGTAGFTAPEILHGHASDEVTDWWAWSATLVSAATGRPPFGTGELQSVMMRVMDGRADMQGLSPELARIFSDGLSPHREVRPSPGLLVAHIAHAAGLAPSDLDEGIIHWESERVSEGSVSPATQVLLPKVTHPESPTRPLNAHVASQGEETLLEPDAEATQVLAAQNAGNAVPSVSSGGVIQGTSVPAVPETQPLTAPGANDGVGQTFEPYDSAATQVMGHVDMHAGNLGADGHLYGGVRTGTPGMQWVPRDMSGAYENMPAEGVFAPSEVVRPRHVTPAQTPWFMGLFVMGPLALLPLMLGGGGTTLVLGILAVLSVVGAAVRWRDARRWRRGVASSSDTFAMFAMSPIVGVKALLALSLSIVIAGIFTYALWIGVSTVVIGLPGWSVPGDILNSPTAPIDSYDLIAAAGGVMWAWALIWVFLALTWLMPSSMDFRAGVAIFRLPLSGRVLISAACAVIVVLSGVVLSGV